MKRRGVLLALLLAAGAGTARAEAFKVEASVPYAFHGWNTAGYSVAIGHSFVGNDFLGLEWTTFNPKPIENLPGVGSLRIDERIEAFQLAYRRTFPLFSLGVPLRLYVGAGAGLGRVTASIPDSPATRAVYGGQLSATSTEFTGELVGGVEVELGPVVALRVGYRYLDSFNSVRQFSHDVNTDTKALEAGASFSF